MGFEKGEVEVYKNKKHIGGFDPNNKDRRISPPDPKRVPNGGWETKSHKFFNFINKVVKLPILFLPIILDHQINRYDQQQTYEEI